MMVPSVIIAAFYVVVIALVYFGSVDPIGAVIAALLANFAAHLVFSSILFRHQKMCEWFAEHITLLPEKIPHDAPEDLLDFRNGKD